MPDTSLRKLETEIARLRALYFTVLYSFRQSAEKIAQDMSAHVIDPHAPVLLNPEESDGEIIAQSTYILRNKIRSQFPRYLRETIFVRLISGLEVFLIDVVREIFLARRDLFHSQNRIEFSIGEILAAESLTDLWTTLINNELRKLQNQGFKEISKFYKNRMNIVFDRFSVPLSTVQEFHDRRHILVHRLGRADDEYRHRYNSELKNLPVTDEYLLNALKTILDFARFVIAEAQGLVTEGREKTKAQSDVNHRVVVEILSEEVSAITDRDFHYSIDDRIGCLGDILVSYQVEEPKQILILEGSNVDVRAYLRILKRLERRKQIIIHEQDKNWSRLVYRPRKCNLAREVIESIAKNLPSQPWSVRIHHRIAERFGISSSQASAAIGVILADDNLAAMIGSSEVQD